MEKTRFYRILIVSVLLLLLPLVGFTASAGQADDYAPILYFEGEETLYPVDVTYFLDNSVLDNLTVDEEIMGGGQLPFLDVNDNIVSDYQNKFKNNDPSVYPTVYYSINTSSGNTVVQYWMFYVFNPGEHNQHEGDWEMVEVVIPNAGQKWVGYSQHYSGQKATWDLVEKNGDHIKVYVSRGSHANYLRSYSGKLGIASDIVGDNGKVLTPDGYNLVELDSQIWLNYEILWGEVNSVEDFFMGQAGPQGPKYRTDMSGTKMWDGVSWGSNLMDANSNFFLIEWFLYNFLTIIILISAISLSITAFRIYRRHKKHGLGPRIVSMFYIDGINLHTIGNILCFVGIIVAIVGLFGTWYTVSADINIDLYPTSGLTEIITLDGVNGMQIFMPSLYGPVPMGSVVFPFTFIVLIGFIFMVLATIGLPNSTKLGFKYIFKGVRLILIIVVLLVALMLIGNLTGLSSQGGTGEGDFITGLLSEISSNPAGGTYSAGDFIPELSGGISFQWGLGSGAIYLIIGGIILLVSGFLEFFAKKEFFKPKKTKKNVMTALPQKPQSPVQTAKTAKEPSEEKPNDTKENVEEVCPHCNSKIKKDSKFCTNCGKGL